MRRLLLIALLPLACSREQSTRESDTARSLESQSADALILRIPRGGGTGRIYKYPRLDSAIWTSTLVPAVNRALAFDDDAGSIALIDEKGRPLRLDLRLNETHVVATKSRLSAITSADGSDIFAVTAKGEVVRFDPSGNQWTFKPKTPPRALLAEPDGKVIVASGNGERTSLALLHPPDSTILDTATLPAIGRAVQTQVGDRVYFTAGNGLVGVKAKDLSLLPRIPFKSRIHALAPTPSGDRLYVATITDPEISVIDRYTGKVATRLPLSAPPVDLRMDPLGRYLLARMPTGDSAWVVEIGSNRVNGAVATKWTTDLPAVAPDGALALLGPKDVTFVDGETLKPVRVAPNGARDFWFFFAWDGFRPRPAGVDQPVTFGPDSGATSSTPAEIPSSTPAVVAPARKDSAPAPAPPVAAKGYVVSFAAVLSEARAKELAAQISVNGTAAHVTPAAHGSTTVYRVLIGPFPSREEAEKIGKASARPYWIYEATP